MDTPKGVKLIEPTDEDVEQPPRYLEDRYYSNGEVFFRYNPPKEAREEGIVESCVLGVGEPERFKAYREAERLNRMIDEWRIAKRYGWDAVDLYRKSMPDRLTYGQLAELVKVYLDNPWTQFVVSEEALENYRWMLLTAIHEPFKGAPFGTRHINTIGRTDAEEFHQHIQETRGKQTANFMTSCLRRVFNQAIQWGLTRNNPFSRLPKADTHKRASQTSLWTDEYREKLMVTAASRPRWRDAYKVLCLMRDQGMTLRQALTARDKYGNLLVDKGNGKPYEITHMSKTFARLREEAGLPADLKVASAFRRKDGHTKEG